MADKFYMFMVKTLLGNFVHSYMLISPPKCAVQVFLYDRNSGGIHFCKKKSIQNCQNPRWRTHFTSLQQKHLWEIWIALCEFYSSSQFGLGICFPNQSSFFLICLIFLKIAKIQDGGQFFFAFIKCVSNFSIFKAYSSTINITRKHNYTPISHYEYKNLLS